MCKHKEIQNVKLSCMHVPKNQQEEHMLPVATCNARVYRCLVQEGEAMYSRPIASDTGESPLELGSTMSGCKYGGLL